MVTVTNTSTRFITTKPRVHNKGYLTGDLKAQRLTTQAHNKNLEISPRDKKKMRKGLEWFGAGMLEL
jgi:hypothetical protein